MSQPKRRKRGTTRDMMTYSASAFSITTDPTPPPLVDAPRCVSGGEEPCGRCHYCRLHTEGPEYWAKGRR